MRVKNIKIAIKSEDELFKEVKETWVKVEKGEKVAKYKGLYFENLVAIRKVLTENRLKILKIVKKEHPSSIYELAKMLKRDVKNTFDDIQFLVNVGLIELDKRREGAQHPYCEL